MITNNQWAHIAEIALKSAKAAEDTTERIRLYAYAVECIGKASMGAVTTARDEQTPWVQIAAALDVSRQAAQKRYGKTTYILAGIGEPLADTRYGRDTPGWRAAEGRAR